MFYFIENTPVPNLSYIQHHSKNKVGFFLFVLAGFYFSGFGFGFIFWFCFCSCFIFVF